MCSSISERCNTQLLNKSTDNLKKQLFKLYYSDLRAHIVSLHHAVLCQTSPEPIPCLRQLRPEPLSLLPYPSHIPWVFAPYNPNFKPILSPPMV